jgi:hypothetical protein
VQHLGYVEFGVAGRLVAGGAFRRLLQSQIMLQVLEQELDSCATLDEWIDVIRRTYRQFGFRSMSISLRGSVWSDNVAADRASSWELRVPIEEGGYINFSHAFAVSGRDGVAVPFIELLRKTAAANLARTRLAHLTAVGR